MSRFMMWIFLAVGFIWAEGKEEAIDDTMALGVEEVLVKMAKAAGSESAESNLKNLKVLHRMEMLGMGMVMEVEMISSVDSALLVTTMNGTEMARQGYDGKTAWSKDMMMGLRPLEGQERHSLLQATLKGNFDRASLFDKIILGKVKSFKGKEVLELIEKKKGLPNSHVYVDVKTWLVLGTKSLQSGPQGELEATMKVEKYKKLKSGLQYPVLMTIEAGPMKMRMSVKNLEENIDLKDVVFSMPKG